ncbi:Nucleoside-diphosphate-sugar epimerase [Georgenia satyanarayanai]|uniref:Nucleoside-diphosphate-sugar epimerase n=1 Tax=Georgenia satyanarayanai TaxID=860221 RepID=A0A2Y9A6R0_9MICO|nr:NAD-dependent epimerase/dehydratase family protein [Georgenia satyanarayanai]PYG00098.1 nucleoside-diphosphate-sugar epimerase [Georgenia satyanarayanai]SSA40121.1 Nucleoside-diphosphate-sugar epimerase [Georgenia satyanarayanai]
MRRVLVLGGTAWLGREVAGAAVADGAEVVCLARGTSGDVPDGARLVRADRTRPGAYGDLDGEWDAVVELAYQPELVGPALDALADRAAHWTLVSSISVYAGHGEPGADESSPLVDPTDPADYAHAKVSAERASAERLDGRLHVVRPGLVAGPGDPSDRFGYWPARLRRGGRVLTPEATGQFVQVVDVADLAAWIVRAGLTGWAGTVDAVGSSLPLGDVLGVVGRATGFAGELVPAEEGWLLAHDVRYWAGPRSPPLWLPASHSGHSRRSNAAYLAAGGTVRPLGETVDRVLRDEVARGLERERRSGLGVAQEAELLELLTGR